MIYKNEKFIFLYNKSKEYHQEDVFIAIKGTTKEASDIIEFDTDYSNNTIIKNIRDTPNLVSVSGIYKVDCDIKEDSIININSVELLFDISKIKE